MEKIINLDRELFLYLNCLGSETYDLFFISLSNRWIWIPFYILLFSILYKNYRVKSLVVILIFIALGITASDQLAGLFKNGILRLRPCHDALLIPKMRMIQCGGLYGFYSSHASNSFFLASFLSVFLPKKYSMLVMVLFLWAALVSYSRIYLGVHFPLDILMGSAMGVLLGGLFARLALKTNAYKF